MFEVLLSCLTPSAKTGEKSQPASTMILIKNPTDVLRNRRHLFQNAGHTQVNKWEYPNTFTVCAWIWMAEPTVIETHYPLVWTVLYHSQSFNWMEKKENIQWEAVLCVKMPHWCQMSEDNGQTVSSWYEGNSNLNIQLLKFKMCKQLKILCSFSVLSSG